MKTKSFLGPMVRVSKIPQRVQSSRQRFKELGFLIKAIDSTLPISQTDRWRSVFDSRRLQYNLHILLNFFSFFFFINFSYSFLKRVFSFWFFAARFLSLVYCWFLMMGFQGFKLGNRIDVDVWRRWVGFS